MVWESEVGMAGTVDPFPMQEQFTENHISFVQLCKALSHFCMTKKVKRNFWLLFGADPLYTNHRK
jgi:hypothetical protein